MRFGAGDADCDLLCDVLFLESFSMECFRISSGGPHESPRELAGDVGLPVTRHDEMIRMETGVRVDVKI